MRKLPLRRLASYVFSNPSRLLQEINSNASMVQWAKLHRTPNIFKHRFELYEFINCSILESDPIDYLEFGVYKGTSIFNWAELNTHTDSRFYGFDSFEGLPDDWDRVSAAKKKGRCDVGGSVPETTDPRIQFVKGLFQQSLPLFMKRFVPRNCLVIHMDSDLYTSTLYCLTKLDAILSTRSILLFDEFYSSSHEFRAFIDYSTAYQRLYRVLGAVDRNPYVGIAIILD